MEINIIRYIQSFSNYFFDQFFQHITMLAEDYFFIIFIPLFLWCIDKKIGYRLGIATLISSFINTSLKEIFHISRPVGQTGIRSLRLETANGYSFPSGHSQSASSFWSSLMFYYNKTWFYFLAGLIIFLIGFSRIYLGVHYPSDVIVGIILGIIITLLTNKVIDYYEKTYDFKPLLFIIFLIFINMFFIPVSLAYKTSGVIIGLLSGLIIESKYIKFQVTAKLWQQFIKYFLGISILFFIKTLLKEFLPPNPINVFLTYLCIALWVSIGAPYFFKLFIKYFFKKAP